jgi:hypothetical protein
VAELSLNIEDVESLLVDMILDDRITAHIDQIKGYYTLLRPSLHPYDTLIVLTIHAYLYKYVLMWYIFIDMHVYISCPFI